MKKFFKGLVGVVVVLIIIGSMFGEKDDKTTSTSTDTTPQTTEKEVVKEEVPKEEVKEVPRTEVTLSSGNFEAGVDFVEGKYDIVAIDGGGNVSSSNMYSGGLNAILGVASMNANGLNMYEPEYKNIKLPKGTILTINSVTIKLIPR